MVNQYDLPNQLSNCKFGKRLPVLTVIGFGTIVYEENVKNRISKKHSNADTVLYKYLRI